MKQISTFQERLKEAIDGMSYSELGDKIGLSKQAIGSYMTGVRVPKRPTIEAIASALRVSPAWLCGLDVPRFGGNENPALAEILSIPGIQPMPQLVKKPLLGTIACGEPILAMENIENYLLVPDNVRCDFLLQCKGDSMVGARILDGDIVGIRQQEDVENGEVAAVLIGDEATLKRVYKRANKLILQAENPAYEPLVYVNGELDEVRIIGKAVYFVSTIR